jgi:hypothetical protein
MESIDDLLGDDSKVQPDAAKRLPPNAGKGRVKGVPNKLTAIVKTALIESFERAGREAARLDALSNGKTPEQAEALGEHGTAADYLLRLAFAEPKAYATLLGKLLPTQLTGDEEGGPLRFERIERVIVDAAKR